MKQLVLDLITSYENRISVVEELTTSDYGAAITSEGSIAVQDEERERLKTSLEQMLARNCSLRRKDFNYLMDRALSDAEKKRAEIEAERKRIVEKLKEYLQEQKGFATSLRQQLVESVQEKTDKSSLEEVVNNIKVAYQDTGQQLFTLLRDFQSHLATYQREHEEINHKLQRLVDRGESLGTEDLRQLEAANARQDRKVERELRHEEVERLLVHFKQQRQLDTHHGW